MTNPETPEFYPQYCFHLSPTVGKWCHLRAADVVALSSHPGFGGQNIFFHLNHPIQWVRVSGIVTAIDEFAGRRAYTVDDGSGVTIECHVLLSEVAKSADAINLDTKPDTSAKIIVKTPINTGDIIDVKGTIRVFREMKQIKAEKIVIVRTTEQEVLFWEKAVKLRSEVLDKPWVLDPRVVRRCRKEDEGEERRRRKRARSPSATAEGRGQPKPPVTGLERKAKIPKTVEVKGHHQEGPKDALRSNPIATGLEKKFKVPSMVKGHHQEMPKDAIRSNPIATGLEKKSRVPSMVKAQGSHNDEEQEAHRRNVFQPPPNPTGLNKKFKIPSLVEARSHRNYELEGNGGETVRPKPMTTGLEKSVKTQSTSDKNRPRDLGTAQDTWERPPVQPRPLITGLERKRPSVVVGAEIKRPPDPSLDMVQERHVSRRDNYNVALPKPKGFITGLEKKSLNATKRPEESELVRQRNRSEQPLPSPKVLVTGLEKRSKTKPKVAVALTGQYSALGL